MIRVTVWNENWHEQVDAKVAALYPKGIHGCIADFLGREEDMEVRTATLDMPEHGLTQEVLDNTDVLLWWGHCKHEAVADEIVQRVYDRVNAGMGLIVLHSGHGSKIFRKLMGTTCNVKWRENDEKERLWIVDPSHPITAGLPEYIELPKEETYGERFDIPAPDELVFISWFSGGEVFRSGCCYRRGKGRIFYFRPGHEEYPTFYREDITRVLINAVEWAKPFEYPKLTFDHVPTPYEDIPLKQRH